MKKTVISFLASLLIVTGLKAQSIQEGINYLNADRFKSAIGVFEKLLAQNPNNIEATYWLGQVYFDMDDNAAARQVYEKALASNGSAPLLLVGAGHADLLDNKTSDARQKFESALTASRTKKGDDPMVAYAVGRANVDAKAGDFNYAIEKLKAAVDKGEKNAEYFVQLGNAYRKARPGEGGGDAFQSYNKALEINPNYVVANIRLAKLFESQKNWELVLNYLNKAAEKDPGFAPAYYELFYYYFFRSKFNEAEEQLKKYIANTDQVVQNEFLYAQLCWAKKDFDCAITKAESVSAAEGAKVKPKVLKLLADAYVSKGDTLSAVGDSVKAMTYYTNAKKYIDQYFSRERASDVISYDYALKARILAHTGGTADEVYNTYVQGVGLDSVVSSKIDFLKKGAEYFKTRGDSLSRLKEGDLRVEIMKLKPNVSQRDIFDAGFAYYQGKDYNRSLAQFVTYAQKFPDETFGWEWQLNNYRVLDSTMAKGLGVPAATKLLEVAEKDKEKNKRSYLNAANYLVQYNLYVVKDKQKAIEYLKKMLEVDPTNVTIQDNIKKLEQSGTKPNGNPPPKPNSTKSTKATKTPAKPAVIKK